MSAEKQTSKVVFLQIMNHLINNNAILTFIVVTKLVIHSVKGKNAHRKANK